MVTSKHHYYTLGNIVPRQLLQFLGFIARGTTGCLSPLTACTALPDTMSSRSQPKATATAHILFVVVLFFCFCFIVVVVVFETGFLCVTVMTVLELTLIDQASFKLNEIRLHLPPRCWD